MSGTLNLNGSIYEIEECTETRLYITASDEEEGTIAVSIDISLKRGNMKEKM